MIRRFVISSTEIAFQVGHHFLNDPLDAIRKIRRKLGLRNGETGLCAPDKSQPRLLYSTGQFSKVSTSEANGVLQRIEKKLLSRSSSELLKLFNLEILESISRDSPPDIEKPLFVLTSSLPYTQSGYTVRSQEILAAIKALGMDVSAITRFGYPASIGGRFRSRTVRVRGVEYKQNSALFMPLTMEKQVETAVKGLVELARDCDATILHTTTDFKNAVVVSRAANELGIPWVYEIRGEIEKTWLTRQSQENRSVARSSDYFRLSEQQESRARSAAAAVFVISNQIRDRLILEGMDPRKVYLLPNGIEKVDFSLSRRPGNRGKLPGITESTTIVGTVTAVVDYEGLDTLLRAIANLPDSFHALIVGHGEARVTLGSLAKDLGIGARVHFVGKQPAETIDEWYSTIDIFVVPRNDTEIGRSVTPIKAMRAQSMGIPVLASDLPALREVTGGFATFVTPENPAELAEAIRGATDSRNQDRYRSKKLSEWLEGRTWASNARVILQAYERL